jgi:hypothetical protein
MYRNDTFPGMLPLARTYAAWPVRSGSTSAEVKFQPMTKKQARRLYDHLEEFERQTRKPRHQDGIIGRNGLAIVRSLRSGNRHPSPTL